MRLLFQSSTPRRSRAGRSSLDPSWSCLATILRWFVAIGSPLILSAPSARAADPSSRSPNIVLIVADDLGWHDVGFHGSEIQTPNLDRLAGSGVQLDRHYVWPTCSPTRTALLTGRNPSRFGVLGPIADRSLQAVPTETGTLADVLNGRGYSTAIAGKWHLGLRQEVGPRKYGFKSTYGYLHGQIEPLTHLYKNGDRTWHRDDVFIDEPGHVTDLLADEATRWIEASHPGPFFLYLTFSVPHVPLVEEDRWIEPYEGRIAEPSRRKFAASVTHMDAAIGRVVRAIEHAGLREKTLIVFTSDNGGQKDHASETDYGGKPGAYKVLGDNRPLRGWKGELYEGAIRVPAFAYWPGTLEPRVVSAPISALDWLPTFASLVGATGDRNSKWEGVDVWPLLTGTAPAPARRLYWKTGKELALREGDWKLIVSNRDRGKAQLFNLANDPNEATDLASLQPQRVAQLLEQLAREQTLDPKETPVR
jgi:arylsulfatase B